MLSTIGRVTLDELSGCRAKPNTPWIMHDASPDIPAAAGMRRPGLGRLVFQRVRWVARSVSVLGDHLRCILMPPRRVGSVQSYCL